MKKNRKFYVTGLEAMKDNFDSLNENYINL